jgi:acyl-CoA synthetase (NDP forming)
VNNDLDCVFRPRSVAVIGASHDPTKRGHQAVRALLDAGYAGAVHPINPRGGELLGLPVTATLRELSPAPELALICTPAATVPAILGECASTGVCAAVILALGFGETGAEGQLLERQVRDVARSSGLRVVGPNTSGILNMSIGLNLIGARGVRPGGIALLLQSGNLALDLMNQTMTDGREGISICVGAGNQTDLGFADYLRYLEGEPNTRVIAMYVEGFGDGRAFFDAARDPARAKPIVLLKGGRSSSGQAAASSHTGALAGDYTVARAALEQAQVIEVRRSDELFAVAETLARQPPARGAIAILSDGGGHATLAADMLSELHVPLALLHEQTAGTLRRLLGANASVQNPVDLAGAPDAGPSVFAETLQILLQDDAVGGVLVIGLFGGYAIRFADSLAQEELDTAARLAALAATHAKPVVVHSLYADRMPEPLRVLRTAAVPVVSTLEVGCRCIAAAVEWGRYQPRPRVERPIRSAAPEILSDAQRQARSVLLEHEAKALLAHYGVPVVPGALCRTEQEVVAALERFDRKVVLKVVAASLPHKSDAGGVVLHVTEAADATASFFELMALAPDAQAVLVMPRLDQPIAEVLIGARRDAQFGPIIMVGAGGRLAELHKDVAIRLLPIDRAEASEMMEATAVGRLIAGVRGRPAADRAALIEAMLNLGDCLLANPDLTDIETNPIFVYSHGVVAVDARAFLSSDITAR